MFFYIIHQISRNVLFLPDFIISLYYARESVIAKITFEVSRIFCLQRLTNRYIHSIHKCLKPFDCPYCDYKCVRKENIYVYNIQIESFITQIYFCLTQVCEHLLADVVLGTQIEFLEYKYTHKLIQLYVIIIIRIPPIAKLYIDTQNLKNLVEYQHHS